ncbi:hypothetical protein JHK82_050593 [Glycine max]|nr:hypothetical protein JHK82_050593 [Glycine max]
MLHSSLSPSQPTLVSRVALQSRPPPSTKTISRQFNDALRAIMKVSKDYLNFQPCTLEGVEANKWRWFEHLMRLIPVIVSPNERPRYRNRKGDVSTYVLTACGSDLRFIYVFPGWERYARDS